KFESWHTVSFLNTAQTLRVIRDVKVQALEPVKVDALLHIVRNDLGFNLYRAVEKTKLDLSSLPIADFQYGDSHVEMAETVSRSHFESWINPDIRKISACIDQLLTESNVTPREVGSVFLTGGTSFVPKVRKLFVDRFGEDRLRGGDELTSVAKGLALCAADK
ncbi:MAG: putative chaperone protein, partial [Blastocatellia bacterium]|nr:putative chaperone protein [Blastocatellia bacterium]